MSFFRPTKPGDDVRWLGGGGVKTKEQYRRLKLRGTNRSKVITGRRLKNKISLSAYLYVMGLSSKELRFS